MCGKTAETRKGQPLDSSHTGEGAVAELWLYQLPG
jgi:hypothetical protein